MTSSSGFKRLTARAQWVDEIAAVGKRVGDDKQKRAFAEAVLSKLGAAYARGQRAELAYEEHVHLYQRLWRMRQDIAEFGIVVETDPPFSRQFGLTPDNYRDAYESFLRYLDRAIVSMRGSDWPQQKPRPGRKSRTAIEITEMLATEYYRHFGKPAGISKREDGSSPFTRVCRIVERILESIGRNDVSLGYGARREGIDRATMTALRDLLELGPDDTLVVTNPRQRLEQEKKRQGLLPLERSRAADYQPGRSAPSTLLPLRHRAEVGR